MVTFLNKKAPLDADGNPATPPPPALLGNPGGQKGRGNLRNDVGTGVVIAAALVSIPLMYLQAGKKNGG